MDNKQSFPAKLNTTGTGKGRYRQALQLWWEYLSNPHTSERHVLQLRVLQLRLQCLEIVVQAGCGRSKSIKLKWPQSLQIDLAQLLTVPIDDHNKVGLGAAQQDISVGEAGVFAGL
jgi:hypothetical protein